MPHLQASNYSSKARPALQVWADITRDQMPALSTACCFAVDALDQGVHFLLPDDGMVLPGKEVNAGKLMFGGRLPFPVCVMEFTMSGEMPIFESAPYLCRRRLVLAFDMQDEATREKVAASFYGAAELSARYENKATFIWALDSVEDPAAEVHVDFLRHLGAGGAWTPGWLAFVAPYDQSSEMQNLDASRRAINEGEEVKRAGTERMVKAMFRGLPVGESGAMTYEQRAGGEFVPAEHFCGEYVAEIGAVLSMIAAAQCKNVRVREIAPDEKLQKARKKRGKPPLNTYRELVLRPDADVVLGAAGGDGGHGNRARPSEHVRSGHIRRVAGESIWVNWAVVNPGVRAGSPAKIRRVLGPA